MASLWKLPIWYIACFILLLSVVIQSFQQEWLSKINYSLKANSSHGQQIHDQLDQVST